MLVPKYIFVAAIGDFLCEVMKSLISHGHPFGANFYFPKNDFSETEE
jgi:hypothetical protein